jgi:hypothetical protein
LVRNRTGLTPRTPGAKHRMMVPITASTRPQPAARKV